MSLLEVLAIAVAGFAAGMINAIVGSGTLVTFPTLLFFGYPPVSANISNNLGLVAGSFSGTWGYRRELRSLTRYVRRLAPASLAGSVIGAILLLVLPESAFETVVPVLIALALVLVVAGPRLNRWARAKGPDAERADLTPARAGAAIAGIFVAGIYGGYFGGAQGVLLIGVMSVLLPLALQQINALKNALTLLVNLVAAAVFLIVEPGQIQWSVVGVIAVGALLGGATGARVGRAMPPWLLRGVIVVIGGIAIVVLLR